MTGAIIVVEHPLHGTRETGAAWIIRVRGQQLSTRRKIFEIPTNSAFAFEQSPNRISVFGC